MLAYLPQYIDLLLYILSDNVNKQLYENYLEVFWKAKMEDSINCYNSYQYWQDDVIAATSKIISLITLDQDRSQMTLHEIAEDVFTKIGKIIEVSCFFLFKSCIRTLDFLVALFFFKYIVYIPTIIKCFRLNIYFKMENHNYLWLLISLIVMSESGSLLSSSAEANAVQISPLA